MQPLSKWEALIVGGVWRRQPTPVALQSGQAKGSESMNEPTSIQQHRDIESLARRAGETLGIGRNEWATSRLGRVMVDDGLHPRVSIYGPAIVVNEPYTGMPVYEGPAFACYWRPTDGWTFGQSTPGVVEEQLRKIQ